MGSVSVGRAVMAVVRAVYVLYFGFVVKTDDAPSASAAAALDAAPAENVPVE